MRKTFTLAVSIGALALPLAACNDPQDTATAEPSYGAAPNLPAPEKRYYDLRSARPVCSQDLCF